MGRYPSTFGLGGSGVGEVVGATGSRRPIAPDQGVDREAQVTVWSQHLKVNPPEGARPSASARGSIPPRRAPPASFAVPSYLAMGRPVVRPSGKASMCPRGCIRSVAPFWCRARDRDGSTRRDRTRCPKVRPSHLKAAAVGSWASGNGGSTTGWRRTVDGVLLPSARRYARLYGELRVPATAALKFGRAAGAAASRRDAAPLRLWPFCPMWSSLFLA